MYYLTYKQTDNRDDEFLTSRLLFLCTYETDLDFRDIFAKHHLAESLNAVSIYHSWFPLDSSY